MRLLGELISLSRRGRRWSQRDLADRVGISVGTLAKIEQGDASVGLGSAFEAAALTGVPLFHADQDRLAADLDRVRAQAALLPKRAPSRDEDVDDDF